MDFSKKPQHKNPRKGANFISQLFMLWTVPLFWKGFKNGLTAEDLTKCLQEYKSDALGDDLEAEWQRELQFASKQKRKPKLWRALFRIHSSKFILLGFGRFSDIMLRTLLALILAQLLIQFGKPIDSQNADTNMTVHVNSSDLQANDESFIGAVHHLWNDKFSLSTMLVTMSFSGILIAHHCYLGSDLFGVQLKAACCSLMYRKSIRSSASAASQTGTGHVVNLISNDVTRFSSVISLVHYIWILPIQSIIVAYLIWQQAGLVGIIGVTCLLLKTVPVQTYLGRYKMILRKKVASCTDERLGIVNEIVQGIQVIKMYAWEIPFQTVAAEARRKEIEKIRCVSYVHGISKSALFFIGQSTIFISVIVLYLSGQKISAEIVFPMTQYFLILQINASNYYPFAVSSVGEILVSLKRMEDFLLKEQKKVNVSQRSSNELTEDKECVVEMNEVSASWDDLNIETLSKIDCKIKSGQLCAVVGPVGGGKSSLIQLLLGELSVKSGKVVVNGSISYAAQEPWIFSGTVRNNILFGQSYDPKRYNDVVKCCALAKDFEQLPAGDKTFVGDRGASLSGGQRARISLARTMYKTASIYLLDDPLSAVDSHVGKHLFDKVIGPRAQIAENTTRILVTHQVHLLKEADVILILENGQITHRGTYAELSAKDIDFAKLLQEREENEKKGEDLNDEIINESEQVYEDDRNENELDDTSNGAHYKQLKLRTESISKPSMASQEIDSAQMKEEEQVDGSFSWKTFSYYFSIGSNRFQIMFLIFILVCTQCVLGATDYFVKFLTQLDLNKDTCITGFFTQTQYLIIYGALIIVLISICILRQILFSRTCVRSSKALHDRMFGAVLHAPMRFFDSNSSGRILNRMSTDMGSVDEILPPTMMDVVNILSDMCGILFVIMTVNPKIIVALVVSIFLFGLIFKFHLRTSQDLKRLEGIHRSPVLSHLVATINGLATIRACKMQKKLCHEFDELQNIHSSVSQSSLSSTHAFLLWVDSVSWLFLACVTYSFVLFHGDSFGGDVGLSISQALMLTDVVQFGMRQVTNAMQQMISVERIVQYTELEPEHSPSQIPPTGWPSSGNVKFYEMSLRYDPEGEPILKNISLEMQSGFKVGVVGRTGAGKSSLIAALFRLTHIEGLIEIDGINTDTISLASLRSKISIIPQNPVLFSGTMRKNLDPLGKYSDDDIWEALENVQMKDVISLTNGLNMLVMANGSNFSVGQRQLLCLARAILQKNRILVLDEATANVDPLTDQLIQQTIREKFADCTVLTIAHRLHTIIDSDRVLVMDAGECVEFDTPINLLLIENGIFKEMVKAMGDQEYDRLYKIAK